MSTSFKDDYLKNIRAKDKVAVAGSQATPSGFIQQYVDTVAPAGYLLCDGTAYNSITNPEYANLYTAIGNRFGGTDGTNFQVPDMRGMVAKGAGTNGTRLRADGSACTGGNIGDYQADMFHSHNHNDDITMSLGANAGYWEVANVLLNMSFGLAIKLSSGFVNEGQPSKSGTVGNPQQRSSAYGPQRDGYKTKPATISFSYIIKI